MSDSPPKTPDGGSEPELALRIGDRLLALPLGRELSVGSAEDCDLRIAHGDVAPHHATLRVENGEVLIIDHGAPSGTVVRDLPIEKARVSVGESIAFGPIVVLVVQAATATPTRGRTLWLPPAASARSFREREDATFTELMAGMLRGSPWLILSLLIHGILALLLAVWLQITPGSHSASRRITLEDEPDVGTEEVSNIERPQEIVVVEETSITDLTVPDPLVRDLRDSESDSQFTDFAAEATDLGYLTESANFYTRLGAKGRGDDILRSGNPAIGGKAFRKTVSRIRASGLEIVFVFDSTGSMGGVLNATKQRIGLMAETLHALVPDARIGIVTYRDHDPGERYVTRHVPLSHDYFRAVNFMHIISADGGGDRPEAVYDGLVIAAQQPWSPKAKRVVVLIGDAPPHPATEAKIQRLVKAFVRRGKAQVHAIVTGPNRLKKVAEDVNYAFKRIAKAGRGECVPFEDEQKVLQQVLGLAFGREFRQSLDAVAKIVEQRVREAPARMRAAVRSADTRQLDKLMKQRPVDTGFVTTLSESRDPRVADYLVDVLQSQQHGIGARQAAAHALQKILGLTTPPVDPVVGQRITDGYAKDLRTQIRRSQ